MRVLRLHGARDVRLEEDPEPVVGPGEELVTVSAVGLCGSDLHWYRDGAIGGLEMRGPFVLGHEMGGVIAAGPRAGMRVAIDPADTCERCPACLAGHDNLCDSTRFCGVPGTDGSLRERMAWPARLLVPVPDALGDDEVPLLESLGVALHAVALGKVSRAARVTVVGAGPIGLLVVALLRARGVARIVVSEPMAHRRAAALAMGAHEAVAPDPDGIARALEGEAADVAFEVVGDPAAISSAAAAARAGGRVVLVGIPSDQAYVLPAGHARTKGLSFLVTRRMQAHHLVQAMALATSGVIALPPLVSGAWPMARATDAFQSLVRRDGLKVVIHPGA